MRSLGLWYVKRCSYGRMPMMQKQAVLTRFCQIPLRSLGYRSVSRVADAWKMWHKIFVFIKQPKNDCDLDWFIGSCTLKRHIKDAESLCVEQPWLAVHVRQWSQRLTDRLNYSELISNFLTTSSHYTRPVSERKRTFNTLQVLSRFVSSRRYTPLLTLGKSGC